MPTLSRRSDQGFTASQWVTTQWRAAPEGDINGNVAFSGHDHIEINPTFFQRLDKKIEAVVNAGLLPEPVLLWAIGSKSKDEINPGYGLPEDQAIALVKHMVARWQAYPVVWILGGDGNYGAEKAQRWRNIGRAVFGNGPHAPVAMHLGGGQWVAEEFRDEPWMSLMGYQSGHGDSDNTLDWIVQGPPSKHDPDLFYMNLEPCYENHVAYHSKKPHDAFSVRRAIYWSLLNAPTAGVTYGGHGVWGWDDGTTPSVDHSGSGIPLPWRQALRMPAAEQMRHLYNSFTSINWSALVPAPDLLVDQPGLTNVQQHISASRSLSGNLAVVYIPIATTVTLRTESLQPDLTSAWHNPRTGEHLPANSSQMDHLTFIPPDKEDWLLIMS